MKKLNHRVTKIKNPTTGEYEGLSAIAGESAYEIAVRLGTFSGTEEEWNNYIKTERDVAVKTVQDEGTSQKQAVTDEGSLQVKAVEDKGTEVLNSIPEDYTTLQHQANENTDAVKELADKKITKFYVNSLGETTLNDSDNGKIQDMMLYGKSVQDGTPTLDTPIEIQSVVNPVVTVTDADETTIQTATLPYTLNAISVSKGGNVTIGGNQYISDYVDFKRKVLVTRILRKTINNGYTEKVFTKTKMVRCVTEQYLIGGLNAKGLCNKLKWIYSTEDIEHFYWDNIGNAVVFFIPVDMSFEGLNLEIQGILKDPIETPLTDEELQAFKDLETYYSTTNVSVTSEQLDGYMTFNYPLSMENGWNLIKQQLGDTRDYIYDMDLQSAEAYVNSVYAVTLTELGV